MGGRVVSLNDYRELHFAGSTREIEIGRHFYKNLKSVSRSRRMKQRQRPVGPQRDSINQAEPDPIVSMTEVRVKWDRRFLFVALFFVGCLVLVGFGL